MNEQVTHNGRRYRIVQYRGDTQYHVQRYRGTTWMAMPELDIVGRYSTLPRARHAITMEV